jgi:Tfp pilus assembly protein PilN
MIRINLLGKAKVKAARPKTVRAASNQALQAIMAISVLVISIGIIYFWERILSQQDTDLSRQIAQARKEKIRQESLLKENETFEKRRKLLENRISVIESLKKNQSGPVQVLDILSDCVQRTDGLWLKDFVQKENVITLSGIAMGSPSVIADFLTNLEQLGKFKNVTLVNIQEVDAKYSFSITFEGNMVPHSKQAS